MLLVVIFAVWLAVVTCTVAVCRAAALGDALVMPATPAPIAWQHAMAPAGWRSKSYAPHALGTGGSSSRL